MKEAERLAAMVYADKLIKWYNDNKREMPWRKTSDPYKIWISEIMLQQTQVDTVRPYYERFIERFPTVMALAEANLEEVYQYWQGLGYYRRAQNLHKGAQMLAKDFNGIFPMDPKVVQNIPGIGPYTLGAILSIAFHIPLPAVDGNVMRILARQFLIEQDIAIAKSRKVFEEKVMMLMPDDPNKFNQALMELGALICTPKSPKCMSCPVQSLCMAYEEGVVEEYPIKSKKGKSPVLSYFVMIIEKEGMYWLEKRPEEGLLARLWGFPLVEKKKWEEVYKEAIEGTKLASVKHVFTHRIWEMEPCIYVYMKEREAVFSTLMDKERGRFITREEMEELPIGTAFKKVIQILDDSATYIR